MIMRIETLDIRCPKCKRKPKIKKLDQMFYLECNCTKTAGWNEVGYTLSSWVIAIGKGGVFDWIKKVKNVD